ncbi:unnamed protein product [Moneuplotes crassus]|uniref:Uncharacterized protein n=1 Tax=Euplotes crassus TaxID=5936 RepID=A0AAD2DBQ9_EUPCR|nr:unnamed protein product [Moneuplotes crassus]
MKNDFKSHISRKKIPGSPTDIIDQNISTGEMNEDKISKRIQKSLIPSQENQKIIERGNQSAMEENRNSPNDISSVWSRSPMANTSKIKRSRQMARTRMESTSQLSDLSKNQNNSHEETLKASNNPKSGFLRKRQVRLKRERIQPQKPSGHDFNFIMKNKTALANKYLNERDQTNLPATNPIQRKVNPKANKIYEINQKLVKLQRQEKKERETNISKEQTVHLEDRGIDKRFQSGSPETNLSVERTDGKASPDKTPIHHPKDILKKLYFFHNDRGKTPEEDTVDQKKAIVKIKKKKKKKSSRMTNNLPATTKAVDRRDFGRYEALRRKPSKKKPGASPISESILENDFDAVHQILANKNISYGYGDSKNREKVLKFITDLKKQQTEQKEKTVTNLKERMSNIDNLINGLENDYSQLSYEIDVFKDKKNEANQDQRSEEEYQELRDFIADYDENHELYQTPAEIGDFINGLWKTQDEIEEEMENERQEYQWDMRIMENELRQRIQWERNKSTFYIDALEAALNETKMTKNLEIERLNAIIADMESHKVREVIEDEEINNLLKIDHSLECMIITDAHDMISKMKNALRTIYFSNKSLSNQLKTSQRTAFELFHMRDKLLETYMDVLEEKCFYQENIVKLFSSLSIESKKVTKEVLESIEMQKRVLKNSMEPVFKNSIHDKVSKMTISDIPTLSSDEYRMKGFIEEVENLQYILKQVFAKSNLKDYTRTMSISFASTVEYCRELKELMGETVNSDGKSSHRLKRIQEKASSSHRKERSISNAKKIKRKTTHGVESDGSDEVNSSRIKDKLNQINHGSPVIIPVELEKPTKQMSKPKLRTRGGLNEGNMHKIRGLKNITTRMSQDQKIQHLIGKIEDIDLNSSSASEKDFKINMKFSRKTLNIKKFVKNQLVQTEEKYVSQRRKKRSSIAASSGAARRSFKFKKKRSKDSFISSSMSFIDELDIGDGETPKNDYIFLNSELLQNVDDLVNNKFKKSEGFKFSKAKLKRKKFTKASAFSKGSSFAMKSKDLKPFNFNKSLSNFSHEGSTNSEAEAENSRISSSEVIKIIEKLYEKLVACLDNALMRQRFENSFKSNSTESTKKVNKSRQDIFKAKMAIIKTIKRSTQALFMKYSIRERAMKHFFKNLRNLVEKESKDMKVDASRNIKVIFKDILDGDSFNLKKIRNYSEEARGLIGIEEVSSISSNDERSLTKNKSYHTLYSDDQESHTSQSANKRNSFQNEQIRMLAGLKPTTTIVKTQPAEIQCGVETCDKETITILKIRANDVAWDDIDLKNDTGKEAAKTMIALDCYLDSINIHDMDPDLSQDMSKLNLHGSIDASMHRETPLECVKEESHRPKLNRTTFTPFIPPKILSESLSTSFPKCKPDIYATGGGFKLKELSKRQKRNRNNFLKFSNSQTRHRYSRSNVPMNRFREYNNGNRSLFENYLEAQIRVDQSQLSGRKSGFPVVHARNSSL